MSNQMDESYLAEVRVLLNTAFDSVEIDALCLDHFIEVYDKFSHSMRKDAKITLLVDHCRRLSKRLDRLLDIVRIKKRDIFEDFESRILSTEHKKSKFKFNANNMVNLLDQLSEWKTAHNDTQDLLGDIKTLLDFLSIYQKTLKLDVMLDTGSKWQRITLPKLKKIQKTWNFRYAKAYEINKLKNEIITIDVITRRMMSGMDKEEVKELSQYLSQLHKDLWQLLEISDQEIINTVEALRPITQG